MRKQRKKFLTDNKGSSLVEVLVALIVLAITFVPLLISMTTAMKANTASESIMYADNVASRCAEVLKSAKNYSSISQAFKDAGVDQADISVTSTGLTISNLKEGTKTYTATIVLDKTSPLNNPTAYQSVGSISGAWVPVGVDCDFKALRYFSEEIKNSTVKKPVEIANYLTGRNIKIKFYETTGTEAENGKYALKPTITYEVADDTTNAADKVEFYEHSFDVAMSAMYFDEVPEGILIFSSPVTTIEGMNVGGVVMSDALYDYCLAKDATLGAKAGYHVNTSLSQEVTIENTVSNLQAGMAVASNKLPFFCFQSGADAGTVYSSKLKVAVTSNDPSTIFEVYSPTLFEKTGSFTDTNKLLRAAKDDEINKIYDVSIKITNDTTSEVESEMDSTVIYRD